MNLYYKVARDPIHSEIKLYPIEIVFADTSVVQRLRFLSQLAGAEYAYPSVTHTRFSHSLGVMHLAGMYADMLYPDNLQKKRVLRLAGLLHDVGHGPFSHQFDDTVFKKLGYKDGHDEFREKLIKNKLLEDVLDTYKNVKDKRVKEGFIEDLKKVTGENTKDLKTSLEKLLKMVLDVFEGEKDGTVDFNIIQGPLGADRLDFILRDSYYAGTRHFGSADINRIIRNSYIVKDGNKEKLAYDIKVIDDIYTVSFGRFMMYKNVYFHKTSRAADQMIQEILNLACDILNLEKRLENLDEFVKLTDYRIFVEIEMYYEALFEKSETKLFTINPELLKKGEKIAKAYELIQKLKRRELWKILLEIPFTTTGVDPSSIGVSIGENILKEIKNRLLKIQNKENIPKEDKLEISYIIDNFDSLFKIDTPYKLTIMYPGEFLFNEVYIKNPDGELLSFDKFFDIYPAYKFWENNLIQIVRIYMTEDKREILRKYNAVPEPSKISLTTRW